MRLGKFPIWLSVAEFTGRVLSHSYKDNSKAASRPFCIGEAAHVSMPIDFSPTPFYYITKKEGRKVAWPLASQW